MEDWISIWLPGTLWLIALGVSLAVTLRTTTQRRRRAHVGLTLYLFVLCAWWWLVGGMVILLA